MVKTDLVNSPVKTRSTRLRTWLPAGRHALGGAALACTALPLLIESIRFLTYPLLGLLVVSGAVIGLSTRGRVLLRRGSVVLGCVTALVVMTPSVDWAVDWLEVSEPAPLRADVIVVLGAGIHCSTGQLDGTSIARLTSALNLWRSGVAPAITISDSNPATRPVGCPSQATVQERFVASLLGDDKPIMVVLPAMRTTATEVAAIADLQQRRGWKRVVVVTSPTHTRRARDLFRAAGVNVAVVGASEPQYDRSFSRPTHRLNALGSVVREFAGIAKSKLG